MSTSKSRGACREGQSARGERKNKSKGKMSEKEMKRELKTAREGGRKGEITERERYGERDRGAESERER